MWEANGALVPIIFPNVLTHSEVARSAGMAVRQHVIAANRDNWSSKVISAGFLTNLITTGVHGKSESLDIASSELDRQIINEWPYANGRIDGLPVEHMMFEAFKRALQVE